MVDTFSSEKRSEIMRRIGPKNTKPELFIRKLIHSLGYRYRLHRKDLPGTPDLVFPRFKKVIFVHGCYWHGHQGCNKAALPATNTDFWKAKINGNIRRDTKNYALLSEAGWDYLIIWQCDIKKKNTDRLVELIKKFLSGNKRGNSRHDSC